MQKYFGTLGLKCIIQLCFLFPYLFCFPSPLFLGFIWFTIFRIQFITIFGLLVASILFIVIYCKVFLYSYLSVHIYLHTFTYIPQIYYFKCKTLIDILLYSFSHSLPFPSAQITSLDNRQLFQYKCYVTKRVAFESNLKDKSYISLCLKKKSIILSSKIPDALILCSEVQSLYGNIN